MRLEKATTAFRAVAGGMTRERVPRILSAVGAEILKLLDLPRERIAPKLARRRLPL
jgi:hypothetical protein